MSIPTVEPTKIIAGDRVQWTHSDGNRLPATWTLTYSLLKAGCERIEITASDNGDGTHLVSVPAATTADWEPGEYKWQRHLTSGAVRDSTGQGWIEIASDFAVSTADPRSSVKKTLDALTAVIENKASSDQLSMSIQGRSISRMSWEELMAAKDHFQRLFDTEVREDQAARNISDQSGRIKASFENA